MNRRANRRDEDGGGQGVQEPGASMGNMSGQGQAGGTGSQGEGQEQEEEEEYGDEYYDEEEDYDPINQNSN